MKSEEGNKATFSHWPRVDTSFATEAWISLRRLPEAKASKKAVLRVRCLRFMSFIGCFCELIKHNRKVPFWKIPGTFGTIPVKNWRVTCKGLGFGKNGALLDPRCQQWSSCNHQWSKGACLDPGTGT